MRIIFGASLVIALILVCSSLVEAQSPQQYYGEAGGEITGHVIGADGYPVDWAAVHATNNQSTYEAFSGMSGIYLMRIPIGTYNVTVDVPGYMARGATVNVTENSLHTVNFYLEVAVLTSYSTTSTSSFTTTSVPEFQANAAPLIIALVLAATLICISESRKRKPHSIE